MGDARVVEAPEGPADRSRRGRSRPGGGAPVEPAGEVDGPFAFDGRDDASPAEAASPRGGEDRRGDRESLGVEGLDEGVFPEAPHRSRIAIAEERAEQSAATTGTDSDDRSPVPRRECAVRAAPACHDVRPVEQRGGIPRERGGARLGLEALRDHDAAGPGRHVLGRGGGPGTHDGIRFRPCRIRSRATIAATMFGSQSAAAGARRPESARDSVAEPRP